MLKTAALVWLWLGSLVEAEGGAEARLMCNVGYEEHDYDSVVCPENAKCCAKALYYNGEELKVLRSCQGGSFCQRLELAEGCVKEDKEGADGPKELIWNGMRHGTICSCTGHNCNGVRKAVGGVLGGIALLLLR